MIQILVIQMFFCTILSILPTLIFISFQNNLKIRDFEQMGIFGGLVNMLIFEPITQYTTGCIDA